jgi:hypothetical protein
MMVLLENVIVNLIVIFYPISNDLVNQISLIWRNENKFDTPFLNDWNVYICKRNLKCYFILIAKINAYKFKRLDWMSNLHEKRNNLSILHIWETHHSEDAYLHIWAMLYGATNTPAKTHEHVTSTKFPFPYLQTLLIQYILI